MDTILGIPCECHKVDIFHYELCDYHQALKTWKRWLDFYPKYWFDSEFRKQWKMECELHKILAEEIKKECNKEIIREIYKQQMRKN